MPNETTTTLIGNLTADPELRMTPAGRPVTVFTVASTTRVLDAATGEWRDGNSLFLRCLAWRRLGENVAESLRKGTRVVVLGRLQQHVYETEDGHRRSAIELVTDEVAISLRYRTVRPMTPEPVESAQHPTGGAK
jgi:single-strand DNA-binding protein